MKHFDVNRIFSDSSVDTRTKVGFVIMEQLLQTQLRFCRDRNQWVGYVQRSLFSKALHLLMESESH